MWPGECVSVASYPAPFLRNDVEALSRVWANSLIHSCLWIVVDIQILWRTAAIRGCAIFSKILRKSCLRLSTEKQIPESCLETMVRVCG